MNDHFKLQYLNGYANTPQEMKVHVNTGVDYLEIPEISLLIPLKHIMNIHVTVQEEFSWRMFLLTKLPFFKDYHYTLHLTYHDRYGAEQHLKLEGKHAHALQERIEQQLHRLRGAA